MLPSGRKTDLDNDFDKWMKEIKLREKYLMQGRTMKIDEMFPQINIRPITFNETKVIY